MNAPKPVDPAVLNAIGEHMKRRGPDGGPAPVDDAGFDWVPEFVDLGTVVCKPHTIASEAKSGAGSWADTVTMALTD